MTKVDYATIKAATGLAPRGRAPRLNQLADFIRENMPYEVTLNDSWSNTDTKAGRLRIPGKGRSGKKLIVREPGTYGRKGIVFSHDSSETYRRNEEVCYWIVRQMETATHSPK